MNSFSEGILETSFHTDWFAVGFPNMGKHVHHAVSHQSRSRPRPERWAPWRITPCRRLHLGIWHRTSGKVQIPCGAFLSVVLCQIQIPLPYTLHVQIDRLWLAFHEKTPCSYCALSGWSRWACQVPFIMLTQPDMEEREIVTLCYQHSRPHGAACVRRLLQKVVKRPHIFKVGLQSIGLLWLYSVCGVVSWPDADCGWVVLCYIPQTSNREHRL